METKATSRYLRTSSRKLRAVAKMVEGLDVAWAEDQLRFSPKRASILLFKLLNSAVANAEHNFQLDKNNLYIKKIIVNEGSTLKRWRARAYGRAATIRKRSANITLILTERVVSQQPVKSLKEKLIKPKLVQSLKDISSAKPAQEEKKLSAQDRPQEEPREKEIFDVRREGKHRHQEHLDKRESQSKTGKGFLGKFFQRKSV